MARSDDKKDEKRKPSAPRADGGRKKASSAKTAANGTPPAAPKRKAAKPAAPGPKAASPAPRARRASPSADEPTKAKAAAPRPAKVPAAKPPAKAPTTRRAAAKPATAKAPVPKPARKRGAAAKPGAGGPTPPTALDEEERIEDAKYQPRAVPRRLFEEERFIFPDSYGQSRIRLLVKDPDWLFAHWDVDPQSLADLRAELGERASALSSFTLRVVDPQHGGESRVLLPEGARSWYVRADAIQRSYRAELGLTLPSGEFRSLAQSNVVTTPRTGPARVGGPRRMRYDGVTPPAKPAGPAGAPSAGPTSAPSSPAGPGPWRPDPSTTSYPGPTGRGDQPAADRGTGRPGEPSGGASDVYRR
ncbi:MAG TPA: DUF4912 domain-containing protein [Vicinamibacteria bacterium]|nr:DUF4912 domain-containing protein [Vicinamibacteria bacterium]